MNHSNLRIITDNRNNHPYAVPRRLQFFAHNAGVKLVPVPQSSQNLRVYLIVKGG